LFKPEKFVCDELGFFGFELFNPRVELTNLFDPRVEFELLFETQLYGQANREKKIRESQDQDRRHINSKYVVCSFSLIAKRKHDDENAS
jgi:hypothetical protein